MKLTAQQINILEWAIDMDNNGDDWIYTRTKGGETTVYIRRHTPGGNSADPEYWQPEEDITEEYVENCKRFSFWGE